MRKMKLEKKRWFILVADAKSKLFLCDVFNADVRSLFRADDYFAGITDGTENDWHGTGTGGRCRQFAGAF